MALKTNMTKSPYLIGDTSSDGCFSHFHVSSFRLSVSLFGAFTSCFSPFPHLIIKCHCFFGTRKERNTVKGQVLTQKQQLPKESKTATVPASHLFHHHHHHHDHGVSFTPSLWCQKPSWICPRHMHPDI